MLSIAKNRPLHNCTEYTFMYYIYSKKLEHVHLSTDYRVISQPKQCRINK